MSASVCAALIWKRIVSSPRGTTGKVRPTARMPRSKSPRDHGAARVGVAHEQRHDRMRARESTRTRARSSPRRNWAVRAFRLRQPVAPLGAVGDVDGLDRRGAVGRAERVRVDVGVRLLPDRLDQLGAARDEPAVDAERLAERADEDVDARAAVLFGPAARRAVGGDAVRIVHHRDHPVAEPVLVPGARAPRSRRPARCRRAC